MKFRQELIDGVRNGEIAIEHTAIALDYKILKLLIAEVEGTKQLPIIPANLKYYYRRKGATEKPWTWVDELPVGFASIPLHQFIESDLPDGDEAPNVVYCNSEYFNLTVGNPYSVVFDNKNTYTIYNNNGLLVNVPKKYFTYNYHALPEVQNIKTMQELAFSSNRDENLSNTDSSSSLDDCNTTVEFYNINHIIKITVCDKEICEGYQYQPYQKKAFGMSQDEGVKFKLFGVPGELFFTLEEFNEKNKKGDIKYSPSGRVIIDKDYKIYNLPFVKVECINYKTFYQYFNTFMDALSYAVKIKPENCIKILQGERNKQDKQ